MFENTRNKTLENHFNVSQNVKKSKLQQFSEAPKFLCTLDEKNMKNVTPPFGFN